MDAYFADHKDKRCLLLGGNDLIGTNVVDFCMDAGIHLGIIDLESHKSKALEEMFGPTYQCVESGNQASMEAGVNRILKEMGDFDYIVCNYYLDDLRKEMLKEDESCMKWESVLKDWGLNYFLLLKTLVTRFEDDKKRKIVYFNSARGYTGEGEGEGQLVSGGSIIEAACASGVTGMMTSIARSIIPKGYGVNGVALGEDYSDKWDHIEWAMNLWLTGIGEYSCGETYRVY
jgi:NAD(P)-dependent dehydrogenase (short-subunit alcohol dehydrogenase family)